MSWKSTLSGVVIITAVSAAGYWVFLQRQEAKQAAKQQAESSNVIAVPSVTVSKVATASFVETAVVSGSLVAREEILVSPEIEGLRVLEVLVEAGDTVKQGQVLARLVSEQLDAQLAQNEANVARTVASIAQARSQITQAEAKAKETRNQLERAEPLKKSGYLSGATYDERESAANTAEAALVAARDGLNAAEAEKVQAEATRRELNWRRGNADVKAPADGIISKRNARIGAMASGSVLGEPMFRMIENGEIELDAEVVETDLRNVAIGQKAVVSVPGLPDADGTVRLVSPTVDSATRLGRVRIFLGARPDLRIGAFARGRIETARGVGLAVPASSVTFDPNGAYVQIVNGDKIERRALKTGLIAGDLVEAKEGLKEGDLVVTRAGTFLRNGDSVRPVQPSAALSEAK